MKDILILAGPSAVGKNTVAQALLDTDGRFSYVRSLTTRPPRDTFTQEYLYVSEAEFVARRERAELLESTAYAGYFYGTPRSEIERIRAAGKRPLLILDIPGVRALKTGEFGAQCYAVYLYADLYVLEQRLYRRELNPPSADGLLRFAARKEQNRLDFSLMSAETLAFFDFCVENEGADAASVAARILQVFDSAQTLCDAERETLARALRAQSTKDDGSH